jgi:hypothetical protein
MWKLMQKQIIAREHGIVWVEYITDPKSRIQIGEGISTNNIILLILFDKVFSNIVVCISFDTNITSVLRR